ncbi:MAG: hypothetical protein OQK73_05840 [Gammaproteobacteria bacterium]|nr:hypothetical protein [Gammaproteobacteria bacterium]
MTDYCNLSQEVFAIPFAMAQTDADAVSKKEAKAKKAAKTQCKKFAKAEQIPEDEMADYMAECVKSLAKPALQQDQ